MAINSLVLSHEEKRIREFYQIVYLLQSLDVRRGDRIKGKFPDEENYYSLAKHRRNIADALAYMAAYDKKPDRVTAVALGKENGRLVVWIAANKTVRPEVTDFLAIVLSRLEEIVYGSESEKGKLLDLILKFNRKGVQKYYDKFCRSWEQYCESRQPSSHDVLQQLDIWVRRTFYKGGKKLQLEDMMSLARECHQARHRDRDVFHMLSEASGQGIMRLHEYGQLHDLLYKIGKNVTLCRKLIHARRSLSEDFKQGAVVKSVDVPPRPLHGIKPRDSFDSIAAHIFRNDCEKQAFYDHVNILHDRDEVLEKFQNCAKDRPPPVHAEIQLINYFDRQQCQLLDESNPYIGCSKPACYLCYRYITDHPRRWLLPPSHQKLYHRWSLPEPRGQEDRERFLATTAEVLQHDLRDKIAKKQGPRSVYDDSTAGATTAYSKRQEYANSQPTYDRARGSRISYIPSARAIGVGVEGTEKLDDDTDGGVSLL
ncbi:hypothetical protein BDV38DRAFT_279137 [Aspergillus pseudotamarii]|uniref:Uncharacterized protein n=1 Tax=Aspergillus pseudotamarii TaxID=132259 RepID=A0A5N6T4V7_ASPPS|nr:uncharacterized protein BDV38DRAFT_279137 [Aspergillus pseudotamarii]KAE8141231.1 hypothetical protein BDV38DRAFT_279137 [Aspergillus pseudotamarii]